MDIYSPCSTLAIQLKNRLFAYWTVSAELSCHAPG